MRIARVAATALTAAVLITTPLTALAAPASAPGQAKPGHYAFAVIGDVPYGAAQIEKFPSWVQEINDADVELTVHVGDIKNGSSRCDDSYFATIRATADTFEQPFVYTPGDNEWTDCHRTNNGSYNPLERLDALRDVFYPAPGTTLGEKPMKVESQSDLGLPENVSWREQGVTFTAVHVVGSNNSLAPWSGLGNTSATPEQVAEEAHRMEASIAQVKDAFADAEQRNDRAVAIFLQADMFDPTWDPTPADTSAFNELVQVLVDESNAFDGQTYLFDGDSHVYNVDQPLAAGSKWLAHYGVTGNSDLTRVTVDGSSNNVDWLKVTINRPGAAQVLSWEQVPYRA